MEKSLLRIESKVTTYGGTGYWGELRLRHLGKCRESEWKADVYFSRLKHGGVVVHGVASGLGEVEDTWLTCGRVGSSLPTESVPSYVALALGQVVICDCSEQPLGHTRMNLWRTGGFIRKVYQAGQVDSLYGQIWAAYAMGASVRAEGIGGT
ncbi:hypothetical protein TSMEX_004243 [Taenia solium]|eukprot:TsM_000284700 transcript=TsM_000284700 gene=TsM_000284700